MATLAGPSSSPVSSPSFNRRRKSWARRIERCCCSTITHFPLAFVYGLTTWAIYVEVNVAFLDSGRWSACAKAVLGVLLYGLANASYTVAVFTNPGSPLDPRIDLSLSSTRGGKGGRVKSGYDVLPTHEDHASPAHHPSVPADMTLVTAKASNGSPRYCKKCHTLKPDRSHHCSTCGRCVLKMDHHCPWLATCVGLRNYKAFLLFLIYTSLYCWLCFGLTGSWVWAAVTDDSRMRQSWLIINNIMLAVLSGIIGLVLSGFTGWHIYLVCRGETTIESLEKTRYLSPLRKSMAPSQHRGDIPSVGDIEEGNGMQDQEMGLLDQLKETHANALPGILRPEEGESSHPPSSSQASPNPHPNASPAKASLQRSYAAMEVQRERDRYNAYLDEQDSEKLPNAFNLGWRRNLRHVFGQQALLWFLPVCNTSGDGWMWEVSPVWQEARAEQEREREARMREDRARLIGGKHP
ncbi:DHHC palmitoyltransferase-domain-containing protein [Neohortaea acidophila]|uniref:Palmitoyltransferase n=1 Tax=Neohortaea acidophila TaxID=245834 RepID=A0A6A6Q3U4_9PEZI|nr:DHHC palmitoyltransferase-domain-containing protein [Neohortaea acidophila]KAF2486067.1 DHHC palmitoyltransferase-domain-containing protein [Neohortaea acidophila]